LEGLSHRGEEQGLAGFVGGVGRVDLAQGEGSAKAARQRRAGLGGGRSDAEGGAATQREENQSTPQPASGAIHVRFSLIPAGGFA
jgi:hypothetical protein